MSESKTNNVSPYTRMAEAEAAFLTITGQIEGLAAHKAYEPNKAQLDGMLVSAQLLRHQFLGLVGTKLSGYEQKQASKMATPSAQ